jgi:hypothetical protein
MTHPQVIRAALFTAILAILVFPGCATSPSEPENGGDPAPARSPRLALWLAQKDELLAHESASYDLVMTAWFESWEAQAIRAEHPSAKLLAGLTTTWVFNSPEWMGFLVTVANEGDPDGPLQITNDMYLMFDDDEDGVLDRRCSPPGWEDEIYAMDPRHPGWRELILAFYDVVGEQPQHDGVIVDMVDAYPFCEGAWSGGVQTPLYEQGWVDAQEQLLADVRSGLPSGKWLIANAGRDFPEGSPFPQYLNGYVLENALGDMFGLQSVRELIDSAERALTTTNPPHIVVYAVDTDDTGEIDWARFRTGLVASLLTDNTYFAFDSGPRDHGEVDGWWFEDYYDVDLGEPTGPAQMNGMHAREFDNGMVVAAGDVPAALFFPDVHIDVATGVEDTTFIVFESDARIFVRKTD